MFRLLSLIPFLLLPNTIFADKYNGWFLHSSCALLQTEIRPAYQLALNEAQAVIDLHDMGDPDFAELKTHLLPSQQDKVEDAIRKSSVLVELAISIRLDTKSTDSCRARREIQKPHQSFLSRTDSRT